MIQKNSFPEKGHDTLNLENTVFIVPDVVYPIQAQNQSVILPECFSVIEKTDVLFPAKVCLNYQAKFLSF